jgi:DNA-directed RNA polymerase subunit M/transcription elongation factor TFIIS
MHGCLTAFFVVALGLALFAVPIGWVLQFLASRGIIKHLTEDEYIIVTGALSAMVWAGIGLCFYIGDKLRSEARWKEHEKCPQCGHSNSTITETVRTNVPTTTTKTRRTTHYDSDGNEKGYSETEYEAEDTSESITIYRKCDSCGHTWSY